MRNTKELKRYKIALIKYKLALKLPILKYWFNANEGFCHHFNGSIYLKLPTLYSLRPEVRGWYDSYWFKPGDLKPRIELLEKAIELCKKN